MSVPKGCLLPVNIVAPSRQFANETSMITIPISQRCIPEVREKLASEEAQSFHIALPRFLWRFIVGLHIAPFVWALRKGKGRLCVDPSNTISDTDDGAANANIPPPGTEGREDECPAVHYSTAIHRHLTQIWNLRISNPSGRSSSGGG